MAYAFKVVHTDKDRVNFDLANPHSLTAVSPIDGRYTGKTADLRSYFSEAALMRYRLAIEVEYLIVLRKLRDKMPQMADFPLSQKKKLVKLYQNFSLEDAKRVKEIEKITNHDVKAIEYFLKEKMVDLGLGKWKEFVHFGLTSQDITNMALPLMMKDATEQVYLPLLSDLIRALNIQSEKWIKFPLLSLTHGQPASPKRLGREIRVFIERLEWQQQKLDDMQYFGKFGGATGDFNAHHVAYPEVDWKKLANKFVHHKGLMRQQATTQIAHYDGIAEWCDTIKRINTIILDLNQDMWLYVSRDVFKLQVNDRETGSSAMPHKVNPIDFENSEGNVHAANAIFEMLARTLPVSRMQRDLSDSTLTRNLGVPLAHSVIALKSTLRGLGKIEPNETTMMAELDTNWAVVTEGIQTILRREGFSEPYETIKQLTRGKKVNQEVIHNIIESLEIDDSIKDELKAITPWSYIGMI